MAAKTIAQLMEEARIRAGAQNYKGHDYMDLARFDENTRHMIILHVLTHDSPVGDRCGCICPTKATRKPLRMHRAGTSAFFPMQKWFKGTCGMIAKTQFGKEGIRMKSLLRRLVVPP